MDPTNANNSSSTRPTPEEMNDQVPVEGAPQASQEINTLQNGRSVGLNPPINQVNLVQSGLPLHAFIGNGNNEQVFNRLGSRVTTNDSARSSIQRFSQPVRSQRSQMFSQPVAAHTNNSSPQERQAFNIRSMRAPENSAQIDRNNDERVRSGITRIYTSNGYEIRNASQPSAPRVIPAQNLIRYSVQNYNQHLYANTKVLWPSSDEVEKKLEKINILFWSTLIGQYTNTEGLEDKFNVLVSCNEDLLGLNNDDVKWCLDLLNKYETVFESISTSENKIKMLNSMVDLSGFILKFKGFVQIIEEAVDSLKESDMEVTDPILRSHQKSCQQSLQKKVQSMMKELIEDAQLHSSFEIFENATEIEDVENQKRFIGKMEMILLEKKRYYQKLQNIVNEYRGFKKCYVDFQKLNKYEFITKYKNALKAFLQTYIELFRNQEDLEISVKSMLNIFYYMESSIDDNSLIDTRKNENLYQQLLYICSLINIDLDADDRADLIRFLLRYNMRKKHSHSLKEFEAEICNALKIDYKDCLKFTVAEQEVFLLAKKYMDNHSSTEDFTIEDLNLIAPYVTELREMDFSIGIWKDMSLEQVNNFLFKVADTSKIVFRNYPLETIPNFQNLKSLKIENAMNLAELPALKGCKEVYLDNTALVKVESDLDICTKLTLINNKNLTVVNLNMPLIQKIRCFSNPVLKEIDFELCKNLKNFYCYYCPNLESVPLRDKMPELQCFLSTGSDKLQKEFSDFIFNPEGRLYIENTWLTNNPKIIFDALIKYVNDYGSSLQNFPQVKFVQDGVISSTIDQGGPRRQLFGSLIQEIVKNSGNGFINFIEKEASYFPVLKSTKNKFNQEYANEKEYFHMLGQLLGVSIVNGSVIGPAFSLEIYSAIVDVFRLYYYYDVDRDCKELVFYVILKNVCPAYKDICNLIISSKLKIIDEDEACEIDDYCITDVDAAEHRSAFEGALYLIADYLDQDEKDKLALEANISNLEEIENLRKLYSSHPDVFYIASKHALICRLDTDDRDSFGMAAATLNLFEGFDLETKDMNCPALDDKEILLKDKSLKALEIKKLIEGSFDRDVLLESFIWDDYILDSTDNEMIELSTTIKTLFDQWFQSCSEEKLHQFLGATTGSLYMPKGLEVTLLLNADPERYPAATTCSKLLYLPRDIDPKGFNEKMDYFVAQYQSGSFQFQLQ